MHLLEIFHSIFLISAISVIWFYTDWVDYYLQLFGIFQEFRLKYRSFVLDNPDKYFPDFLYSCSLQTNNRLLKFFLKLLGCPFCLIFWFSVLACVVAQDFLLLGTFYICSLFIVLQIKKLI